MTTEEQPLIERLIEHGKALMEDLAKDSEAKASDKVQLLTAMTRLAALDAKENKNGRRPGIDQYRGIVAATTGAANGGERGSPDARKRARNGAVSARAASRPPAAAS